MRLIKWILCFWLIGMTVATTVAQISFQELPNLPFLDDEGYLRGISWVDVDNDNDLDVCVSGSKGIPPTTENITAVYINQGNGVFADLGLLSSSQNNPMGHSWADIDNDGDLDGYFAATWNSGGINELYLNDGSGNLTLNLSSEATPNQSLPYEGSVSWGDYDNDGFVDLFLARWNNADNTLYHNNGDGTFTQITTGAIATDDAWTSGGFWGDYDNDNDLDLYVVNYQVGNNPGANDLFENNGDGTFTKLSPTAGSVVTDELNSRTANWVDADNNGFLDLFVANQNAPDKLYLNNGDGTFGSQDLGSSSTSWSSNWGDFDNDGDEDLFVMGFFGTDSKFWQNNGQADFTEISGNYPDILPTETNGSNSNGIIWVDENRDGWLDLHLTQPNESPDKFFRNDGDPCKSWLEVKCTGSPSNTAGIGTIIRVKADIGGNSIWQMRQVSAQTSKPGTNPMWLHVGLEEASFIDSLVVQWPSGESCLFTNVAVNQFVEVKESDCTLAAIIEPPLIAGTSQQLDVCNADVQLTPVSGVDGVWTADCGACIDPSGLFSPVGLETGDYQVLYALDGVCGFIDTFQVSVATPNAGPDNMVEWCVGQSIEDLAALLSDPADQNGQLLSESFDAINLPFIPTGLDTLFYYVVGDLPCQDTSQIGLTFLLTPELLLSASDTSVLAGTLVDLFAEGATDYNWTPEINLSCTDCSEPVFAAEESTTFTVTATADGLCPAIDTIRIEVIQPDDFQMPNAFTPNGDGMNDVFMPVFEGPIFIEYRLQIFNRWGEVVFDTTDPNQGWNGLNDGKAAPSDVYAYLLVYKLIDETTGTRQGDVSLIR
jgi:gliding motility-associated-like protein